MPPAAALFHIISPSGHASVACPSTGPSILFDAVLLLLNYNSCSPFCLCEDAAAFKALCVSYHPGCPSTVQYVTPLLLAIQFRDKIWCASSMHAVILPPLDSTFQIGRWGCTVWLLCGCSYLFLSVLSLSATPSWRTSVHRLVCIPDITSCFFPPV